MLAVRVFIDASTIRKKKAGLGVFAGRPFQRGAVGLPYHGSLVYRDFIMEPRYTVVYGDAMTGVTADSFRQTGMGISLKIRDHDGAIHDIWIVPPFFCVGGYVNDPIYCDDDEQKSM